MVLPTFFGFPKPPTWNPTTNIINGMQFLGSWWPTSGGRNNNSAALTGVGSYGFYWFITGLLFESILRQGVGFWLYWLFLRYCNSLPEAI